MFLLNFIVLGKKFLFEAPGSSRRIVQVFCPLLLLDATGLTSVAVAIHSVSLSLFHHMMSLDIDMKIIRPWNCSGSPILLMNSWTSRTSSNVENPVKIFHSNSIGSPSIVSKVLYCGESLNQPNCRDKTVCDVGF